MDSKTHKKTPSSAVTKAVKNINKLVDNRLQSALSAASPKPGAAVKAGKITKPKAANKISLKNGSAKKKSDFPDRGAVYLSHIPHGFYEEQMKEFFSQFGHVTRLRLVRSDKTGNSKGYAFVEFRFREVAQVVAETMNNYLMRNRLLKAQYIPPKKIGTKMFKFSENYGPETCIGVINRRKVIQNHNKPLSESESKLRLNRHKQHLIELQEKLKAQGVDCVFQIDNSTNKLLLPSSDSPLKASKSASSVKSGATSEAGAKQSSTALTLKKQSDVGKGQTAQKNVKPIKSAKSVVEKSSKKSNVKNDKKKTVEKKGVVKKVIKKKGVAKVGPAKKEALKKVVAKKQIGKKK